MGQTKVKQEMNVNDLKATRFTKKIIVSDCNFWECNRELTKIVGAFNKSKFRNHRRGLVMFCGARGERDTFGNLEMTLIFEKGHPQSFDIGGPGPYGNGARINLARYADFQKLIRKLKRS